MGNIEYEINKAEKHLKELYKLQLELKLKSSDFCKRLDEYTDEEKIKHFENIHSFATDIIQNKADGEWHEDNDNDNYAYETVMGILARNSKTFWDDYNKFFNAE